MFLFGSLNLYAATIITTIQTIITIMVHGLESSFAVVTIHDKVYTAIDTSNNIKVAANK